MTLVFSEMSSSNHFHIEADRTFHLKILNVAIYGSNRVKTGILTWDASSGNMTQPIGSDENNSAFMTHIENCHLNCASIWLNDSDSRIINNYIWANKASPNNIQYAIRLSNGSVNVSGNDIVPGNEAGIYLANTCSLIRIENNYFDGSWTNVLTGWGIYSNHGSHCIIQGNTFANIYKGGIYAKETFQTTINGNIFFNCNRSSLPENRYDIILTGSSTQLSTGHIVTTNQHFRNLPTTVANYAVYLNDFAQATVIANSELDWSNGEQGYCKPSFSMISGKYTINKDNRMNARDAYPVMIDEGQCDVGNSTNGNSVYIAFTESFSSLGLTPKIQDIHINFVGASSNSAVVYSVWGVSSSGFFISYKPLNASSITSGAFCWRVSIQ